MSDAPPVAFLGLVERGSYVSDAGTDFYKHNLIGLKHVLISYIYPSTLSGFSLALAFYNTEPGAAYRLVLLKNDVDEAGFIDVRLANLPFEREPLPSELHLRNDGQVVRMPEAGWTFLVMDVPSSDIVLDGPASYRFILNGDPARRSLGSFRTAVLNCEPQSESRIAAIRSDPGAARFIRVEFGCKHCDAKVRAYAALDRDSGNESAGYRWYRDLPTEFLCSCSRTRFSLETIRQNLHGLLGRHRHIEGTLAALPLYESSALETVRRNLWELLRSDCAEEILQKYIEENPIVLHSFSPTRLFFESPILSFRKTDFAIRWTAG